jgi:hypothetical protein
MKRIDAEGYVAKSLRQEGHHSRKDLWMKIASMRTTEQLKQLDVDSCVATDLRGEEHHNWQILRMRKVTMKTTELRRVSAIGGAWRGTSTQRGPETTTRL